MRSPTLIQSLTLSLTLSLSPQSLTQPFLPLTGGQPGVVQLSLTESLSLSPQSLTESLTQSLTHS
jgi:hypothetical protein